MRSFEEWYAESKLELNCFQNHLEKQWFVSNVAAGYKAGQESRQTEVDELQKRVEELTVGCGLQRHHIKGLETELKKAWTTVDQEAHKNHELVMLLKFVKEHFEMNDLDKAMPRVYEKLEQALTPQKGGASQ